MGIIRSNEYAEVYQILNILGNEYKEKLPTELLALFEEQRNRNYSNSIETKLENGESIDISRNALIIISVLNLKYWANEKEIEKLKKIYQENENEYQKKKSVYKVESIAKELENRDWERDKDKIYDVGLSLVLEENIPFMAKIIRFFKNIRQKWERRESIL